MGQNNSAVLEYGVPEPFEAASELANKLRYNTDVWDLSVDLKEKVADIVVIDARSKESYSRGHIPGAVSFPHRQMNGDSTAKLDRDKVYVVYCDGIGCNGSTKGAFKLAKLGLRVKELLGGLDWWIRDGHPVATGNEPGDLVKMIEIAKQTPDVTRPLNRT
jgi:rhodanese-related sulfurtransferase